MDGVHDLGGMDGFGPVEVEADEPVFHHAWERRVFALAAAIRRSASATPMRSAMRSSAWTRCTISSSPYYEHWITGMATSLVETRPVRSRELEARAGGPFPLSRPVRGRLSGTTPTRRRPVRRRRRRARAQLHPLGHTRCPRYVRGQRGAVMRVDGRFPLPDVSAHGGGRCEQTYSVRFAARDLWGEQRRGPQAVYVDLWESYLDEP